MADLPPTLLPATLDDEAANGSPLLLSPDRTGGKHPVAAAALEAGKTADAWLERRPSSDAERSSTPTSRRRGA